MVVVCVCTNKSFFPISQSFLSLFFGATVNPSLTSLKQRDSPLLFRMLFLKKSCINIRLQCVQKGRLHFQYPAFWVISPFLFLFLKLNPVRRFGFLLRAFLEYNSSLERHYQASQHLRHVPYIISRRISAKVCSKGNGREVPFVKFNSMKKVILQTRKFTFQIIILTKCGWIHNLPSYIAFLYHNTLCMEMYIKPLAGCPSWTQTLE